MFIGNTWFVVIVLDSTVIEYFYYGRKFCWVIVFYVLSGNKRDSDFCLFVGFLFSLRLFFIVGRVYILLSLYFCLNFFMFILMIRKNI